MPDTTKASEFMRTDLVPLAPTESAWSALALMRTHDVRSLPVMDDSGQLVGVLSLRSYGKILEWVRPDGTLRGVFDVRVEQIMLPRSDLHPVRRDTPLHEVARILAEERIDSVPVVDEAGRPIGMLRYPDIIKGLLTVAERLETGVPELAGMRVLVVEDDESNREVLRQVLEAQGAVVVVADSAEGALEVLRDDPPSAVVSDLKMPARDGYWLIGQLRANGSTANIAAVALTGFDSFFDRQSALAAGFHDYLVKPIDPKHLCRAIARAISRS
jgi:CheY-like chemotaxis protein